MKGFVKECKHGPAGSWLAPRAHRVDNIFSISSYTRCREDIKRLKRGEEVFTALSTVHEQQNGESPSDLRWP